MTADVRKSWTTSVSDVEEADVFIRGYSLGDLIGNVSFASATYLLIKGALPTPGQTKMIDAILCSVLDYSLKKPGTVAARYCVSGNPSMQKGVGSDPEGYKRLVPAKRKGLPEEVAAMALFLATDAGSYVSGQAIAIDGGWTAT